jgi:hypothetical protein
MGATSLENVGFAGVSAASAGAANERHALTANATRTLEPGGNDPAVLTASCDPSRNPVILPEPIRPPQCLCLSPRNGGAFLSVYKEVVSVLLRYGKIAGGFLLLAAGIAMIALPGPGWLTIFAALAILAGEFLWARKLLDRLKSQVDRLRHRGTS